MQIVIMNKSEAKKESYKISAPKTALISITDTDGCDVLFARRMWLCAVLRLKFDDVQINEPGCISEADARRIAEFINRIKDRTDRLIVHCEAGVSRSAGVAAAVMKIMNGDDSPIFGSGKYRPNRACYEKVLNAFESSDRN